MSSLDSLVSRAKKLTRLSHEHAKVCESFRNALKESDFDD
jgi:Arc/MetJ family transcription regulator